MWLRLTRKETVWQAATSTDGKTWLPAGAPVNLHMAGAWVGLFAPAHKYSFGGDGKAPNLNNIRAVFDRAGGTSDAMQPFRIGNP